MGNVTVADTYALAVCVNVELPQANINPDGSFWYPLPSREAEKFPEINFHE